MTKEKTDNSIQKEEKMEEKEPTRVFLKQEWFRGFRANLLKKVK